MRGFLHNHIAKILVILLAVVLGLIVWSYCRIDDRFILTVDSFSIKKASGITVGQDSDIIFDKIPSDYMSLDFTEDSMSVSIDSKADTLLYYKINGKNPNLHLIKENTGIIVNYDGNKIEIPYDSVKDIFESYSRPSLLERVKGSKATEYIMLKHIIALMGNADESLLLKMISDELFKSFVYSDDGEYNVCILDRFTEYGNHGYKFTTTAVPLDGIYQIQFFKMTENVYKKSEPSNTDVVINDIYYAVKPTIITTEWGAGHVAIKPEYSDNKLSLKVLFPKGLTYAENIQSLSSRAQRTSNMMTVSQSGNSFPIYNNIYIPAFSKSILPDFASVVFDDGKLMLIDTCNDTTEIDNMCFAYPDQQPVRLDSGSEGVDVRTGVLDGRYLRSYCVFPTLMYLLMLAFGCLVFRERGKIPYMVNGRRVQDFYQYFGVVLTILYAYVLCKIFIAVKLSYTYPYFEKLSGIVVTSTCLMLLLMTTISALLNFTFMDQTRNWKRSGRYTLMKRVKGFFEDRVEISAVVILILGYALCVLSMYLMDHGNSLAMKLSYGNGNVTFFSNPLDWSQKAGINDTHRSVCYMLFLVEFVLLAVLFLKMARLRIFKFIGEKLRQLFDRCPEVYRTGFLPTASVAVVCLILASLLPGNYATALITIIVVLALSRMVITYEDLTNERWRNRLALLLKVFLIFLVFVFAIIPDQGYMVAYLGLFCAVMIFPVMTYKVKYYNTATKGSMQRMNNIYRRAIVLVLLAVLLGGPFLFSLLMNPDEVSWGRFDRRMQMFSSYNETRESGYRYSEADMEFMQIMCHYMQDYEITEDPLSNDEHFLHKSISTGQSPVVLNDVSAQAAFFGPIGWPAHMIFFLLLVVLLGTVQLFCFASEYRDDGASSFKMTRHRLTAVLIWVGASAYLYISYLGLFPYTGRLIYGFGVDSVGEALEICVLLAFMTHIAVSSKEDKQIPTDNPQNEIK